MHALVEKYFAPFRLLFGELRGVRLRNFLAIVITMGGLTALSANVLPAFSDEVSIDSGSARTLVSRAIAERYPIEPTDGRFIVNLRMPLSGLVSGEVQVRGTVAGDGKSNDFIWHPTHADLVPGTLRWNFQALVLGLLVYSLGIIAIVYSIEVDSERPKDEPREDREDSNPSKVSVAFTKTLEEARRDANRQFSQARIMLLSGIAMALAGILVFFAIVGRSETAPSIADLLPGGDLPNPIRGRLVR